MTISIASLKNYHQAPRKVRLVADLVRGKSVQHSLALLSVLPKRAALPMEKLIKSAVANAKDVSANDLYISKIEVNGGIVFKRMMPRARGRGAQILKRTSHVTLALDKRPAKSKVEGQKAKDTETA